MCLLPVKVSNVNSDCSRLLQCSLCRATFLHFSLGLLVLEMDCKHLAEMPRIVPNPRSCNVPYGENAAVRQFFLQIPLLAAVQCESTVTTYVIFSQEHTSDNIMHCGLMRQ